MEVLCQVRGIKGGSLGAGSDGSLRQVHSVPAPAHSQGRRAGCVLLVLPENDNHVVRHLQAAFTGNKNPFRAVRKTCTSVQESLKIHPFIYYTYPLRIHPYNQHLAELVKRGGDGE